MSSTCFDTEGSSSGRRLYVQLNVLLTVHHDINFIPFTNLMHKFLYSHNVTVLYMFRAVLCSSSGGQILCIQHIVSSLCISDHGGNAVHQCAARPPLPLIQSDYTIYVYIQFDLLIMSIILLETCRGL